MKSEANGKHQQSLPLHFLPAVLAILLLSAAAAADPAYPRVFSNGVLLSGQGNP